MSFTKGKSGNPNGRPKGARNKAGREARNILRDVIEAELTALPERLAELSPAERIAAVTKLVPYVLPRLNSITDTPKGPTHIIVDLPPEMRAHVEAWESAHADNGEELDEADT